MNTPTKKPSRSRTYFWRALVVMLGVILLIPVVGAVYETLVERGFARDYPPPGQLLNIGSHRLHLYCTGSGDPTVILEAGSGLAHTNWTAVQAGLSDVTRVCSYDRAGLGWSDPGANPSSADQAVSDLYELLRAAGMTGPWVLAGHSLGGLYVQQFMNLHPEDVAGLFLFDSAHEDQFERVPYYLDRVTASPLERLRPLLTLIGAHRIFLDFPSEDDPTWVARQLHATSRHLRTAADEWWSMQNSAEQVRSARVPWGDVPLAVISAGKQSFPPGWTEAEVAEVERNIAEMNQELASRSTRGQHIVVEDSGHGIPWERPDVVIAAIDSLVQELRGTPQ